MARSFEVTTVVLLTRGIYTTLFDHNLDLIEEIVRKENINKYRKI